MKIQFPPTTAIPLPIRNMKSSLIRNQAEVASLFSIAEQVEAATRDLPAGQPVQLGRMPFAELMLHPEKIPLVLQTGESGPAAASRLTA